MLPKLSDVDPALLTTLGARDEWLVVRDEWIVSGHYSLATIHYSLVLWRPPGVVYTRAEPDPKPEGAKRKHRKAEV